MKVRTTNALMKYLREKHNISIEGTNIVIYIKD